MTRRPGEPGDASAGDVRGAVVRLLWLAIRIVLVVVFVRQGSSFFYQGF